MVSELVLGRVGNGVPTVEIVAVGGSTRQTRQSILVAFVEVLCLLGWVHLCPLLSDHSPIRFPKASKLKLFVKTHGKTSLEKTETKEQQSAILRFWTNP